MHKHLEFGVVNLDKPPGPTSHDIVAGVRRRLGRGVKVGHAGTLDPFARGVLVVCDLCRHDHEWMRTEYGDQWLGFADEQARQLLGEAGFEDTRLEHYQTPRVQLFLATARAPGRTS